MKYLVVYTSRTGNTEKAAMEIFEALPGRSKDIQRVEEVNGEAETYFIGFWNDRGICGENIMEFLSELHGKKIALFATSGMGAGGEYGRQLMNRVEALIPEDNEILGSFVCLGKMGPQVLERYRMMQLKNDTPQIRAMIKGYEEAMLHPDEKDLKDAREFVHNLLQE